MTKDNATNMFSLFLTFFKIGAFTFGGGYAMIPLIQKEVAEKNNWVTNDDILEIIAIAESTPGPISVNTATFIGYKKYGVLGACIATLGLILPSFLIILLISSILREFQDIQAVQYAFNGIRAGVLALIVKALFSMYKQCPKGIISYIVILLSFLIVAFTECSVLYVLIGCALFGLVSSLIINKNDSKEVKK